MTRNFQTIFIESIVFELDFEESNLKVAGDFTRKQTGGKRYQTKKRHTRIQVLGLTHIQTTLQRNYHMPETWSVRAMHRTKRMSYLTLR